MWHAVVWLFLVVESHNAFDYYNWEIAINYTQFTRSTTAKQLFSSNVSQLNQSGMFIDFVMFSFHSFLQKIFEVWVCFWKKKNWKGIFVIFCCSIQTCQWAISLPEYRQISEISLMWNILVAVKMAILFLRWDISSC